MYSLHVPLATPFIAKATRPLSKQTPLPDEVKAEVRVMPFFLIDE